jgi:putative membrane protein insertion efficiency factor
MYEMLNKCVLLLIVGLITLYQKFLSPYLGANCRFYPSCSQYTKEALNKYGVFKGAFLALLRIAKCHPFHPGGVDLLK